VSNVFQVGIVVDPFLLEYLSEHTGHCTVLVKDADDPVAAQLGLEAARRIDPLAEWTSFVESTGDGLQLSFEAGATDLLGPAIEAIVAALESTGLTVGLITHPPTAAVRLETATAPDPPGAATPPPAGWPVDIPLPEPRQELFGTTAPGACERSFMVPHAAETLMSFFEQVLPRQGYPIILSLDMLQEPEAYVGRVFFRQGNLTGQVAITDAGSARHLEISLKTDPGSIRGMLSALGEREELPPGIRLRLDNRG
jgi:hypothetical protein